MKYYDKLVFELSREGRTGYSLPANPWNKGADTLPAGLRRSTPAALPQVSEVDVVRHYTNLSQMNFWISYSLVSPFLRMSSLILAKASSLIMRVFLLARS